MATLPPPPPQHTGAAWGRWLQYLWSTVSRIRLGQDSPTVSHGAGVPAATEPNGSLYLRTDGAGPNLYVREGGAWVAK